MRRLFPFVLLSSSLALGCSFEYDACDTELPIDATSAESGTETCKEGSLCFEIAQLDVGDVPAGRVAVIWHQLASGDPEPEPFIGYEAEFDPQAKRFSIPLDAIAAPTDEALMLCERACNDEAACGCRGEVRVSTATVILARDDDRDGRTSVREGRESRYGRGAVLLAYSEKDYPISPPPADQVFSDGIRGGLSAYRFLGNPEERDARVVRAEADERFALEVCTARECSLPFPAVRTD